MPAKSRKHVSLKSAEFALALELFWLIRAGNQDLINYEFTDQELAEILGVSHQSIFCLREAAFRKMRVELERRERAKHLTTQQPVPDRYKWQVEYRISQRH